MDTNKKRYEDSMRITLLSTIVNTLLMIFKFIIGVLSNSTAMIADAVHSLSDFASDAIIFIATKISQKPSDEEHPFGHSKIETISSFILGIILCSVGLNIGYQSILKIISWANGEEITFKGDVVFWVVVGVSIISKEILFHLTNAVGKKHDNESIIANAWHHRSDALSSVAVLIGALIAYFTDFVIADSISAIIVSLLIIKVGVQIIINSGNTLIDVSADKETVNKIKVISKSTEGVENVHAIRTRKLGHGILSYIDIEVNRNISVNCGHQIAEEVKKNIMNKIDKVKDVIIHVDPYKADLGTHSIKSVSTVEIEKISTWIKEIEKNISQKIKVKKDIQIRSTEHNEKIIDINIEIDKFMPISESYKISRLFKEEIKRKDKNIKFVRIEMIPF